MATSLVDLPGSYTLTSLQNVANINASGSGTGYVDLAPYIGTGMVVINNSTGASSTALQCKLFVTSDSNTSNYNNYTTSTNYATATNIGTAAGSQVVNIDLRAFAGSSNRYLGISHTITGATANVSVDAFFIGQKKVAS